MNAEILQEMYRVVLQREPESRASFGALVEALNQGAKFEGIYNGLVNSDAWSALENSGRSASPAVLRAFTEEIVHIQLSLPPEKRREFTSADVRPLARATIDLGAMEREAEQADRGIVSADGAVGAGTIPSLPAPDETWDQAVKRVEPRFVGANLYTLKRLLGDEVMRVIEEKRGERLDLVVWFGKFAARTSARGIDFGLQKRNELSADFHRNWAWSVSVDRIQWEALNRVHRILNAASLE